MSSTTFGPDTPGSDVPKGKKMRMGKITAERHIGERTGWLVSDLHDEQLTITNQPDAALLWPNLLKVNDHVVVIRTKKSRDYPNSWVGKLAPRELQSQELQKLLSERMTHSLQDIGGGQWIYGPYLVIDNECPCTGYRYQLTYKAQTLTWLETLEEAVTLAQQEIEKPLLTREPKWPKKKESKWDERMGGSLPEDLLKWMVDKRPQFQSHLCEEGNGGATPQQMEAFLLRHPFLLEKNEVFRAEEGQWIAWDGMLVKEVDAKDLHHRAKWLRSVLTEMGVLASPHPEVEV